jgi:HlyD family secretion protein
MRNIILPAALLLVMFSGCGEKRKSSFAGSGTIEATEVTVSARTRGELKSVSFKEGDTVKKDQVLAEIDMKNLSLQRSASAAALNEIDAGRKTVEQEIAAAEETLGQAKISWENARVTRDRIAGLQKEGAATADRLDRVETEYALAESRVRAAEKQIAVSKSRLASLAATRRKTEESLKVLDDQIGEGMVHSPLDGVVIEKFVEQGEVVNFGSSLCTVADLSSVWLIVYVGEESVGKIRLGGNARVQVDSFPDRLFDGRITWISPRAEFTPKNVQTRESRVDLVYAVKITLPNPEGVFKIGMPAEAFIEGI